MTKRVKLLSVMVAAVLCFVAGFALMFGSNKAQAEVEVPTVGYSDQRTDVDWSNGKNFAGIGIGIRSGLNTDWAVLEYYVPVGASVAKAGNITFALLVNDTSTIGSEGDGVAAHATYAYSADSPYVANATDADVKVVLAMDIENGKVYGSVADSEFAEIATFANISYVADAEKLVPYWILPDNTIRRLNNVKIYTEEGIFTGEYKAGNAGNFYQGGASFNADMISMINIPATAVKPTVSNVYAASGVKIRNANPTTSDWIFVEYTLSKDTTAGAGADPNGYMTVLSNNGYDGHAPSSVNENYVGVLHNNETTYTQSNMHNLFNAVDGADTDIKIAVNTKTGLMATYINGELFKSAYQYSEVSALTGTDRYFYIANNSAKVGGVLKNVIVYDGNGVDLGLVTPMAEMAPEVDASAIEGIDRSSQSSFWFATKTATTSKWIILEWTNGEYNATERTGGGWTWGVAIGDENLASVTSTNANVWHDFGTTYLGAETAGKDIKVTVNTENGQITVYVDGVAKESATRSIAGLSNFKFRTGGNDAYTYNSTVYDLKAYDENGNDLGIETNMSKVVPTIDNVVAEEKFYAKASGSFNAVNATATTSEWVFFEFDNLAGSTVTAPGGTCHWFQSVQDGSASVYVNNTPFTNGIANQYNNGNYAVNAFNNATGNTVHTIIAIDTTTGTSYVSKDGGAFSVIMAFNGTGAKGDFPNTSKSWYAGFQVNAGNEGVMLENFKCYDAEGNDLGVVTTLNEIVEATVVYANISTGAAQFNRYQGNVYFKDTNGEDITAFGMGEIPALKYGEQATTLTFVSGGGALQLFMPTQNGKPDDWYNQWSDYDNEWYVVEAGTLVGGKVVLAEDMIIRMHNQTMQIFNASHEFAITDGENEIATYTFNSNDTTALTTLPDGADGEFVGWFLNDSRLTTVMDVSNAQIIGEAVLTAKYAKRVTLEETIVMGLGAAEYKRFQTNQSNFVFKAVADGSEVILNKRIGTISLLASGVQIDTILIEYGAESHLLNLSELGWVEGTALEVGLQWYVIPAETVLGNIILDEDIILRANGTECVLMPVDGVYNVTYEGLEGAENTNATTYSYGNPITLTDLADKAGYDFLGWFINGVKVETITFGEYVSDVVVTAKWAKAELTKYNATITASKNLTVNFYADIEEYELADVKVYVNGSATPIVGVYDATRGLYKFSCEMAYADLTAITIELKVGDQVKDTATVNMITRLAEVAASDEDYAALIGSYIAYATATNTTAGSGNVPADAFVGQVAFGEIGIRDNANKWVAPATGDVELVFETAKTGTLQVEINGVKQDVTVEDGEIVIDLSSFTNASNIGAKLTIKVFDGATQVGNTAVLNMMVVLGTEMSQVQASAMSLYVSLLFLA